MRRWRCLLLALVGLSGCETVSNPSGLPLFSRSRKLADPKAVANCLPPMIYLDTLVTPPSGARPFRVEDRLAKLGAQVREAGTITDSNGEVLYVKPKSFPPNALRLVMEEDQKFLKAILTEKDLAGLTEGTVQFTSEMKWGD